MKKNTIIFFLLIITILSANPFLKQRRKAKPDTVKTEKETKKQFVLPQINLNSVYKLQRTIYKKLPEFAHEVKVEPSFYNIGILILFAFIYGVLHSIGPGHGKIFVTSWFLANKASTNKGVKTANYIAFMHAASGFLLVVVANFIVKKAVGSTIEASYRPILTQISYGIIILLGIWTAFTAFKPHEHSSSNTKAVTLALGLVPCPGAIIIALSTIHMQVLWLGGIMVLAMALGMAFTLSILSVTVISFRHFGFSLIKSYEKRKNLAKWLKFAGALFILLIGTLFFVAGFQNF